MTLNRKRMGPRKMTQIRTQERTMKKTRTRLMSKYWTLMKIGREVRTKMPAWRVLKRVREPRVQSGLNGQKTGAMGTLGVLLSSARPCPRGVCRRSMVANGILQANVAAASTSPATAITTAHQNRGDGALAVVNEARAPR